MAEKKEFDVADFVNSLDANEDEKRLLSAVFAKEKNVTEVRRGWNSVAEGSRLVDEARTKAQAAETATTQAAAEKAEAERLRAEAQAELERTRTWHAKLKEYEDAGVQTKVERNALAAEKVAYEEYLQSIGVEPSYALSGRQPIKPGDKPAPPAPNGDSVIDQAKFDEILNSRGLMSKAELQPIAQLMVNLPFELNAVQMRHLELYGKMAPVDKIKELQTVYLNPQNTRELMDLAAESFHYTEREQEIAEQKLTERAGVLATEMFEKRLSELHLPAAAIERIRDDIPAKFASDDFSKNVTRAGEVSAATISDRDMEAFLQVDTELAAMNIRPNV